MSFDQRLREIELKARRLANRPPTPSSDAEPAHVAGRFECLNESGEPTTILLCYIDRTIRNDPTDE